MKILNIPNSITILRFLILSPLTVFLFLEGKPIAGFFSGLSFLLSDVIDGYLARKLNQATRLGAILDTAFDHAFMLILALTFLYIGLINFLVFFFLLINRLTRLVFLFLFKKTGAPYYHNKKSMKFMGAIIMVLLFTLPITDLFVSHDFLQVSIITITLISQFFIVILGYRELKKLKHA